jgi:hypothetical protein
MRTADRIAILAAVTSISATVLLARVLPPVFVPKQVGGTGWLLPFMFQVLAVACPVAISIFKVRTVPAFAGSVAVVFTGIACVALVETLNVKLDPVEPELQTVKVLGKHIAARSSSRYRLTFRMGPTSTLVEVAAPRAVYETAVVGQVLHVRVGQGYFGTLWIESFANE